MFIISTAKVRQINDTTKYFVLKNVKGSIFFPEPQLVSPSRGPESNLSEIKTWSQTSAIIIKKTSEKKIDHFLK